MQKRKFVFSYTELNKCSSMTQLHLYSKRLRDILFSAKLKQEYFIKFQYKSVM